MRSPFRRREVRSEVHGSDRAGEVAGVVGGAAADDRAITWLIDQSDLRLGHGDSVNYTGDADLVFSHLYGPLPPQLIGKPAIINLFGNKKGKAEAWCGAELHEVGRWGKGLTNTIYSANLPFAVQCPLAELQEEEFAPGRGWFPEALPLMIFEALEMYFPEMSTHTVFDGFMGRGTVGKVALKHGFADRFVGVDISAARVGLAREYFAY